MHKNIPTNLITKTIKNKFAIFWKKLKKLLTNLNNYTIINKSAKIGLAGCSAVGSARGLGPWGREFEPLHPDQFGPLAQLVRATGS